MAATNVTEREHPGKVILARSIQGNGSPIGDTVLANDDQFPVGTTYLNKDNGKIFSKTSTGTFVDSSAA